VKSYYIGIRHMILQDLIRNIVLYNGVIDPYLQYVKEYVFSLLNSSNRQNINVADAFRAYSQRNRIVFISSFVTGTHTTSYVEKTLLDDSSTIHLEKCITLNYSSNVMLTMPTDKGTVKSNKTQSQVNSSSIVYTQNQTGTYVESTTGSFNEKPNLFFSHETHEKREYLGEFSLPHEEIQINTFIGRG
jgi:hypothetical protein